MLTPEEMNRRADAMGVLVSRLEELTSNQVSISEVWQGSDLAEATEAQVAAGMRLTENAVVQLRNLVISIRAQASKNKEILEFVTKLAQNQAGGG